MGKRTNVRPVHLNYEPVPLNLADGQLGRVPPARTSRFSDGRRSIEEIIEAVIAHQAEHLGQLRAAVRGPAAAATDAPE
ncbi:MAG: hypothetical protein V4502_07820 [Pseudomonadota bacterium]